MHFMNPPPLMKLIELVRAVQTSNETFEADEGGRREDGQDVHRVEGRPGFLVNRMLIPMLCEACFALQEGARDPRGHRHGAKLGLNHPMGPLELADLIGLDTVLFIARRAAPRARRRQVPPADPAQEPRRRRLARHARRAAAFTRTTTRATAPAGACDHGDALRDRSSSRARGTSRRSRSTARQAERAQRRAPA